MKRTHKFKELGDIQAVVAKASSLSAAAKALGVDRSTLHRWLESGKVKRPRSQPPARNGEAAAEREALAAPTPAGWADKIRAAYRLSDTDAELLGLAGSALSMAKTEEHARDRVTAMARFQQLVRQLNLENQELRSTDSLRPAVSARPIRRPGDDPRAHLMAVK